jgi:hypothetical protein
LKKDVVKPGMKTAVPEKAKNAKRIAAIAERLCLILADAIYSRGVENLNSLHPSAWATLHYVAQAFGRKMVYFDVARENAQRRWAAGARRESGEDCWAIATDGAAAGEEITKANLSAANWLVGDLLGLPPLTRSEVTICAHVNKLIGNLGSKESVLQDHVKNMVLPDSNAVHMWLQASIVEPKYKWSEAWAKSFAEYETSGTFAIFFGGDGVCIMDRLMAVGAEPGKDFFAANVTPVRARRNEPCPCGSEKKYKKCCGKPS